MVWMSFVLGLIGLAYFSQTKTTSSFETFLTASGGFILAFSPVVFVMLLPEAVPIHLASGGYIALFFGVLSMVMASAGLRAEAQEEEAEEEELSILEDDENRRRGSSAAAAAYGSIRTKE